MRSQLSGSARCSASPTSTKIHTVRGAIHSGNTSARVTTASTPQAQPYSLAIAIAITSTMNRSSSVQRPSQVSSTWSTPVACSTFQPGGRCSVPDTEAKSWSQSTAEIDGCRPSAGTRRSAVSATLGSRSSTPALFGSSRAVMNCG
ncbi:hypothetical protein [Nannocystis pusilla]|uniref:hypothetical protein n=1 Tax=Nannocystis pusilla TaxID=889268 RepID=UPI003B7CFAD2